MKLPYTRLPYTHAVFYHYTDQMHLAQFGSFTLHKSEEAAHAAAADGVRKNHACTCVVAKVEGTMTAPRPDVVWTSVHDYEA